MEVFVLKNSLNKQYQPQKIKQTCLFERFSEPDYNLIFDFTAHSDGQFESDNPRVDWKSSVS
jgi:hypothetical protein